MRTPIALLACLPLLLPLVACDDEDVEADDTGPIVGVMELAVALRHGDAAPANALRVEASPTELRLDGHKVIDLEGGNVPDVERSGDTITKLAQAIRTGAARRAAAMRIHVNTPWETTVLILKALKDANINQVGFEVRPPGGASDTGWMVIDNYRVAPASDDPAEFESGVQRTWAEFVEGWEEAYRGCRRDHYVDCDPKPPNPVEGGPVEVRLFSRGSALKVVHTRFGVEEEEEPQGQPAMLDGIAPPPPAEGEEEEVFAPVAHGAFTWRFQAATDELSPITGAFRPLCGARPCGIVVTADPETMTLRLVSFLAAAFPNGTDSPHVEFHIPSR